MTYSLLASPITLFHLPIIISLFTPTTGFVWKDTFCGMFDAQRQRKRQNLLQSRSFLLSPGSSYRVNIRVNTKATRTSGTELFASSSEQFSIPLETRGKVNEIDFCMAPSDVSLSRSYGIYRSKQEKMVNDEGSRENISDDKPDQVQQQPRVKSLTRALNNASNRAVRRILLSRSWPSAEALNMSLRLILATGNNQKKKDGDSEDGDSIDVSVNTSGNLKDGYLQSVYDSKCPVPRPILNIIMKKGQGDVGGGKGDIIGGVKGDDNNDPNVNKPSITNERTSAVGDLSRDANSSSKRGRTDEEWVCDQMTSFRESYGKLSGYRFADAYIECILSLATTGVESFRISDVLEDEVYDDSYRRVIAVLKSVGVVFEEMPTLNEGDQPRMKIASKLVDQDICLSVLDKFSITNKKNMLESAFTKATSSISIEVADEEKEVEKAIDREEQAEIIDNGEVLKTTEKDLDSVDSSNIYKKSRNGINTLVAWLTLSKSKGESNSKKEDQYPLSTTQSFRKEKEEGMAEKNNENKEEEIKDNESETIGREIKPEDLGGVLLSAGEPTMTRQLNVLSNIIKRSLLFGGDQELLVLFETLEADKPAFIQRWYPDTGGILKDDDLNLETRPGVQYFNCLVKLLKNCYEYGIITELNPPYTLTQSYVNSFDRLTAILVQFGSGYVKPINTKKILSVIPKTPTDEFQRFSQWESELRQTKPDVTDYPTELVGSWQVKDEIGGKIIGTSSVVFNAGGDVYVEPPMMGLRWRLDPGPTHLDTCTFQVLSNDGEILQYRGFMDRGARLESRFSKRSIKIRGAVTFQMRDGETSLMGENYRKDMLPINTEIGTTRFAMSKVFDLNEK